MFPIRGKIKQKYVFSDSMNANYELIEMGADLQIPESEQ